MLNWFSKYRSPFAAKPASAPSTPAPAAPPSGAASPGQAADKALRKAEARARQAEQDQALWAPRLQAALGDDAALLALAQDCPVLALRQDAVQALAGEDALRQAEIAFRNKDRRLHQVAKRRHDAAVLGRESRARADTLIAEARALSAQPMVPVNHLVVLDRGWGALDAGLLLPTQTEAFAVLRQTLDGQALDQAEHQQRQQRRQRTLGEQIAAVQAAGLAWLAAAEAAAVPALADADGAAAVAGAAAAPADVNSAPVDVVADVAADVVVDLVADAVVEVVAVDLAGNLTAACAALRASLGVQVADAAPVPDDRLALSARAWLQDADALQQRLAWLARPAVALPAPAVVAAEVLTATLTEAPADASADVPADVSADVSAEEAADASADVLADTPADAPMAVPVESQAEAPADTPAELPPQPAPSPAALWASLPAVNHAAWAAGLSQLFARQQRPARPVPVARPSVAPDRPPRRVAPPAWTPAQRDALAQRLSRAEAALADGHLALSQQQLQAFDQALSQGAPLAPADPLAQRAAALAAEHQRLKGWQQWGGGRARDDLAAEAEVLARATAAAADPALADAPKLDLKAHADAIAALRGRWRELDKLGAAASQALWQRFDQALKAAYQPVGERQAAQKQQRQQNQRERESLLAALEAWPGSAAADPGAAPPTETPAGPAASAEPSDTGTSPVANDGPAPVAAAASVSPVAQAPEPIPDEPVDSGSWKDRQRAIDRFQTAWRQLGPLEHTVPAAARDTLRQRHQQVLARLEAPLQQARRDAAARREALIQQAEALAARAAAGPTSAASTAPADTGRRAGPPDGPRRSGPDDLAQQVRQLQADWQHQARELALPRGVEAALWGRFRAALDAVFAQRQAVFQARDAEAAAQLAERGAWIARLTALPADAPAAELRRVLAEVDQAWRAPADLPRGPAMALEQQYRDARGAVQQRLAGAAQRQWQAWCDALAAGLQQAVQREQGGDAADAGNLQVSAPSDPPSNLPSNLPSDMPSDMPPLWQRALADRAAAAVAPGPLPAAAIEARLLVLESALDMPASAEQQAARRLLKLQALKQTLEGRAAPATAPVAPADALRDCLRQAGLASAQQQRLQAVLATLRRAAPGSAGLPQPRV